MNKRAYDDGYAHGYLSDEDLKEIGHTPESFRKHVEKEYRQNVYDSRLTKDEREAYWGILDGANDRLKREGR